MNYFDDLGVGRHGLAAQVMLRAKDSELEVKKLMYLGNKAKC